jgi:multidrug efflux pump subunit AcrA (membrane-fusion protein)
MVPASMPGSYCLRSTPVLTRLLSNQALGNLAQARAQLKQNQQDLARYTKLYNQAVIPAQKFDNVTQTTQASAGEVKADEAAVENAQLNLGWCKVYSPLEGVAGIAQAQVGDLVGTSTLLTTVSNVDPIKVSFPISEKLYLHFAAQLNAIGEGNTKSVFEKFQAGTRRFSMRRVAAMSSMVSEVCTRYS